MEVYQAADLSVMCNEPVFLPLDRADAERALGASVRR
jgi:hypothetical protein